MSIESILAEIRRVKQWMSDEDAKRDDLIKHLCDEGSTDKGIARLVGLNASQVRYRRRKLGLAKNRNNTTAAANKVSSQ